MVNAQNDNSQKKLLASTDQPVVVTNKLRPNTAVYRYTAKAQQTKIDKENQRTSNEENIDSYKYPPMRTQQGAVIPFEIVFDGLPSAEHGFKAQENNYKI